MTIHTLMGPGGATEGKQDDILTALAALLTELNGKLEAGQDVELGAVSLAALETVHSIVDNWPGDFPDADVLAKLEQVRLLLDGTLTVSGTVSVNEPVTVDGIVSDAEKYDLLSYAEELTASDSITPSAGMRIEVIWVQVIPDPDGASGNLVQIGFNGDPALYTIYVLARSAVFVGAVDQALDITLENSEKVTVNIQYREVA
jgi:hypothetical protein